MANPLILLDARVFVAGADLSGYSNEVALDEEAEVKKITTWRSGGPRKTRLASTAATSRRTACGRLEISASRMTRFGRCAGRWTPGRSPPAVTRTLPPVV
jgi:hypothetical protein